METGKNKKSSKALIVVDMQNDFCTGSLAVPGALELIGPISEMIAARYFEYQPVAFTVCDHPEDHCSFTKWPKHCVQGTFGSEIQPALDAMVETMDYPVFTKGEAKDVEEYSGFANPDLDSWLKSIGVEEIEICGVARNYCVEATYKDALKLGYKATILEDLCRSV